MIFYSSFLPLSASYTQSSHWVHPLVTSVTIGEPAYRHYIRIRYYLFVGLLLPVVGIQGCTPLLVRCNPTRLNQLAAHSMLQTISWFSTVFHYLRYTLKEYINYSTLFFIICQVLKLKRACRGGGHRYRLFSAFNPGNCESHASFFPPHTIRGAELKG